MSWVIQSEEKARIAGATEGDEVLYVISVEDLVIAYEEENGEGAWEKLGEENRTCLINRARQYMESFCGEGAYTFFDALKDAIKDEFGDDKAMEDKHE